MYSFQQEIAKLQTQYDKVFLSGTPVTWKDERSHVENAQPVLEAWISSHSVNNATVDDTTIAFLRYALNLIYSTAFLVRHNQEFADRLIDYTSRTLDKIRSQKDSRVSELVALEDELFQDA